MYIYRRFDAYNLKRSNSNKYLVGKLSNIDVLFILKIALDAC